MGKRKSESEEQVEKKVKSDETKPKKNTGTIPIQRGKFKNRYLRKHASLLHRLDDPATGILVTTHVHQETRALGQARGFLDEYTLKLFPDVQSKWPPPPSRLDIDLEIVGLKEEKQEIDITKERYFQAVDSACSGLLFLRFRTSVTPMEWMKKFLEHYYALPASDKTKLKAAISFCYRFLPVERVCPANMTDVVKSAKELFTSDKFDYSKSVAIVIENRNNEGIKKPQLVEKLAEIIPPEIK
ncbi:hypothetical protein HK103_005433 [Boothiomyces macroporosus]|uniref:THUMP domain-containing protein n=1 Tax=Boothiomyces macroporosus TaxID=261099 RepID=A0AAD5Y6M6_9FUNG|nr:hypothetical protein HK103_005433 [Boothiomyces macroporosus]